MQMHFLELPKLAKLLSAVEKDSAVIKDLRKTEKWLIFMSERNNKNRREIIEVLCESEEGIMAAEAALQKMSTDREEWAKELFRKKAEHDYAAGMTCARDEGIEMGFEKGEHQSKLTIARSMKAENTDIDFICRHTGLSPKEIAAL
jgi:predicted transposase/invertase (TIGR01784 family)